MMMEMVEIELENTEIDTREHGSFHFRHHRAVLKTMGLVISWNDRME